MPLHGNNLPIYFRTFKIESEDNATGDVTEFLIFWDEKFARVDHACWIKPLLIEALVIGFSPEPPTCRIDAWGPATGNGSFKSLTDRALGESIVKYNSSKDGGL